MLRPRLLPLLMLLLLVAPPARADDLSLEQMEEAREKYAEGNRLFQKGDYVGAEENFRRSYELMRSPGLLYDVALSLEKQRRWRAAADTYEAYLHDAAAKIKNPRKLEKRVADLRVRATRQEELEDVARPAVRDQGAPNQPGNEMLRPLDGEDRLLDLSGEEQEAPPGAKGRRTPSPGDPPGEKKIAPWIWGVVGGGAAALIAVGVGVGVAVARAQPAAHSLPDVGPGLSGAVIVRF